MSADYAKRIVARASGRAAVASPAPMLSPRGAVPRRDEDGADPFDQPPVDTADAPAIAEQTPASPAIARVERAPSLQPRAIAPRAPLQPGATAPRAPRSESTEAGDEGPRPAAGSEPRTRPVEVEHIVRTLRIDETRQIGTRIEGGERERERGWGNEEGDQGRGSQAKSDADAKDERASRPAPVRVMSPNADRARPQDRRDPEVEIPTRGPGAKAGRGAEAGTRRVMRPRVVAPPPAPRRREQSRLVIGRLLVEIVPQAPAAPPRSIVRTAPAPARPFRAGGVASPILGRPSGLGQS